jgi:hypothetical protein
MSTVDLYASETRPSYDDSPSTTRRQRIRWAGTPVALVAGTVTTVLGFVFHPGEMEDREFVIWTSHHATQFAIAHLLIGIGCTVAATGIWSVLRLARGKRSALLVAGVISTFLGMIGMAYDHLAHGAVGYAFASSPQPIPLGTATDAQVHFETLPYVGWSGMLMAFFPLGVILLGIGLLVSKRVPAWGAILLLLSPVGIMFAGVGPLEVLGSTPLMIGFATVAWAAWKTDPKA